MQNYSRNMPPAPCQPTSSVGCVILLILSGGLLYLFPVHMLVLRVGYALIGVYATIKMRRHIARMAAGRDGESTCTFARSLDYRNIDTWIIRAVYEALQPHCEFGGLRFPLRASDRLEDDLGLDDELLNDLVVDVIVYRTGRLLVDADKNPFYGNVVTVRDLVMFFSHQPKGRPQEAVA
jgi:hypothetical protein